MFENFGKVDVDENSNKCTTHVCKQQDDIRLAVVAIHDRHSDLKKWIDYNLSIGFDDVYVYHDGSQNQSCVNLQNVKYVKIDAKNLNIKYCQEHFNENYTSNYSWTVFTTMSEKIDIKTLFVEFNKQNQSI